MFKKSDKGYYFWEEFSKLGVINGFSTRKFGDMNIKNPRSDKYLKIFLGRLGVDEKSIVKMNQVHGNNVSFVSLQDREKIIEQTDGLVSPDKHVFLVATFADCVPVLFLDKDRKIFGIAHVGWKGAYKEIIKVIVAQIVKKGSSPSSIMAGIGPSIRICCYNVDENRAKIFTDKFPKESIIKRRDGKVFLDLVEVVLLQVIESGISKKNVLDCGICTKDNISEFYSFRGEHGQNSFGLSAAVIGRI